MAAQFKSVKRSTAQGRMTRQEREQSILEEAAKLFSEHGFEGASTTLLAERLGITQPLLYRYFPSKEALIERVFAQIFRPEWYARWKALLAEPNVAGLDRVIAFYKDYASTVLTRNHVRLFMFGGLSRLPYNARHYEFMRDTIFPAIVRAFRGDKNSRKPVCPAEIELVQSLHGALYHLSIRRWVHNPPLLFSIDELIEMKVVAFAKGAAAVLPKIAAGRDIDWRKLYGQLD